MVKMSDVAVPSLLITEGTEPSAPAAGKQRLYIDSTTHHLMRTNSSGTETDIESAAAGSLATDALWDAAGDLVVGSGANTAAKLTIGAAGGHVSRINGAVAWNSGTSNPGSAAAGDRYWRTDLGFEVYYDGTRWLTTQVYMIELRNEDNATWPPTIATLPMFRGGLPQGSTYDVWLMTYEFVSAVITTNNGTNFWTVELIKYNAAGTTASLGTVSTAADTAGTVYQKSLAINALMGSYVAFYTSTTKTLSPGAHRIHGGAIRCRLVIP